MERVEVKDVRVPGNFYKYIKSRWRGYKSMSMSSPGGEGKSKACQGTRKASISSPEGEGRSQGF